MIVSVVIPVYNISAYIERCINSVINQTYTAIDCIIVDDCTLDDSMEKCEELIHKYNGQISFTIIHHDKNLEVSAARNTGTSVAIGEYVFYLDGDDEITPDCIERMVKAVKTHPNVEVVQGHRIIIPYRECTYPILEGVDYVEDNDWIREHCYRIGEKLPVTAWNKFVKKSFIINNSLYFKEALIHEDELWMFYVVQKLTKFCVIRE